MSTQIAHLGHYFADYGFCYQPKNKPYLVCEFGYDSLIDADQMFQKRINSRQEVDHLKLVQRPKVLPRNESRPVLSEVMGMPVVFTDETGY